MAASAINLFILDEAGALQATARDARVCRAAARRDRLEPGDATHALFPDVVVTPVAGGLAACGRC